MDNLHTYPSIETTRDQLAKGALGVHYETCILSHIQKVSSIGRPLTAESLAHLSEELNALAGRVKAQKLLQTKDIGGPN